MRHAFDTALHNEGVATVQIAELMGHERNGMTDGVYFHGSRPGVLWDAIQRLSHGFCVALIDGNPQLVRDPRWSSAKLELLAPSFASVAEPHGTLIDLTPAAVVTGEDEASL